MFKFKLNFKALDPKKKKKKNFPSKLTHKNRIPFK